jgi:hypothetical protein
MGGSPSYRRRAALGVGSYDPRIFSRRELRREHGITTAESIMILGKQLDCIEQTIERAHRSIRRLWADEVAS